MSIVDVIMGRSTSLDQAEEDLGKPEEEEETNLPLHIQRCAKRWAMSYRASKNNSAQLAQIRLFLAAVLIYLVASTPNWEKIIKAISAL